MHQATSIKSLDLDDTNGLLKLYIVLIFYTLFNEEALLYWEFGRGGTGLLVIFQF